MRRSPPPKPPSRAWIWLLGAVGFWSAVVGVALLVVPGWVRTWAHRKLVDKLEERLELPVTIEAIDLSVDHVGVSGLTIGGAEVPIVRIEVVDVQLDPAAWWDGQIRVLGVIVDGGRVQGTRVELADLARRASGPDRGAPKDAPTKEMGRTQIALESVVVRDLWVVVHESELDTKLAHAELRATAVIDPSDWSADVELADVRLQLRSTPLVTAERVRGHLDTERTDEGFRPTFPLRVQLDGVGAPVTPEIAVSGVDGWVELADPRISEVAVELAGGFSDRADEAGGHARLWSVAGRLRRDLSAGSLWVDMAEFELGRVPQVLKGLPLVESEHATVGGRLGVVFAGGIARLQGEVSLEGLNVDHPMLAKDTVRDLGFDLAFAAEIDPAAHRVRVDRAVLEREGIQLELTADLLHPPDRRHRRYRTHARVPPIPCQAVLDAIPAEFAPSLQGFVLDGEFDLDVRFDADYADLDRMVLDGRVGVENCVAKQVPAHASTERLGGGFTHRVTMRDGRQRSVQLFSQSGSFTRLQQISPHMVQAVLTTEDGGFWRHRGFLPSQFRTAMQRNLAAGKVRLGASTITMQMVKNVLLSHERTLSRKFQELFLTWWVETALSKERIMEIYLNVIEFGPGIYGVTRAARHYFGKYPEELTPPEAAYLALMLPSPVRRHVHYCRGGPSPSMQIKLARILSIMRDRKRLSEEDYLAWRDVPLQFDANDRGSEGACLAEIDALLSAQEGQRALTGLLGGGTTSTDPLDEPPDEPADAPPPPMKWTPSKVDPAESDAPGRPAMDDTPGLDGETW
jgi:Transglycosylase